MKPPKNPGISMCRRSRRIAAAVDGSSDLAVNPFNNETMRRWGSWELGKSIVMTLLFIPFLRMLLMLCFFVLGWMWASAILCWSKPATPIGGFRRFLLWPTRFCLRAMFFCAGYYWVTEKGAPSRWCASRIDAPVVVANHTAMFDPFYFMVRYPYLSGVCKAELASVPLFGVYIRMQQMLLIDRSSQRQPGKSVEALVDRITDPCFTSPIIIAPEGTTTSNGVLAEFKTGAFVAGRPVQPVLLDYPHRHLDVSWVAHASTFILLYRALCQFYNSLHVTWLPVYHPSTDEIADPVLFSRNVRR